MKISIYFIYLLNCIWDKKSALVQLIKFLSLELKNSYSRNQQSLHNYSSVLQVTSLWATSLTQLAYLTAASNPRGQYENFFYCFIFRLWFVVLGFCPSSHVTLWILHASHAFQGSAKQTLFLFVGCKTFLPFTECFVNGVTVLCNLLHSLMMGRWAPKRAGVCGLYNIIATAIRLCAFVGWICNNLITMYGKIDFFLV